METRQAEARRTHRPVLPLVLGTAAVVIYLVPGLGERLEYHRPSILAGQLWRLLTGHWTHGSASHLIWDVAAFAVLGTAAALTRRRLFATTVGFSAVAISGYLLFFTPEWERYRGLSGIDSALFVGLAAALWLDPRKPNGRTVAAVAVLLFLFKVGYEVWTGSALFTSPTTGYVVLPSAHLIGAATGAATAWWATRSRTT